MIQSVPLSVVSFPEGSGLKKERCKELDCYFLCSVQKKVYYTSNNEEVDH